MHRIDAANATQDQKFTDGDVAAGQLATVLDAAWATAVQEELVHIVLQGGLALEKNNNTQVWQALLAKFAAIADLSAHAALTNPHGATSLATANRMILRDAFGRAKIAAPSADDDIANRGTVIAYYNAAVSLNLGISQSWQNVTGSRSANVTYQNTSGKPIMISVCVTGYGSVPELQVGAASDNLIKVDWAYSADNARPLNTALQAIIPPGHYYRYNVPGGAWTTNTWSELRA